MKQDETRRSASELLRELIEKIVLTPKPCGKEYQIDLHGDLAGILSIATGRASKMSKDDPMLSKIKEVDEQYFLDDLPEGFLNGDNNSKEKLVAGAGFEPTTFECLWQI